MQAALKHYRQTHSEYLWLHILAAVVLVFTSVFWFVLPYFMIHYGKYTTNVFQQSLLLIALYTIPSIFITLHCWFINFKAALRWKKSYPKECVWRWSLRFQFITISIVVLFTSVIYSSLFIIDMIR
ncbi:hypothetical protein MKY07_10145 [Solibacillus sp. FSL W7-1472]|uniref:Uncharacterized protein n=1 Tax=Solibacillus isronensis B3W22 TaxID=1224748 RepID=K1L2M2_9BACL|nr:MULTISPECIES: hypothetical protein [Solibacillus]AMO85671.1 hypothetical protein SOLI23_08750 [Solibacillus silvestris]EKB46317.1 hypothetical protein B857_00526 [Solibacillus isronensis B3W22]OBW60339.1 hypothetical protein A9986_03970 [Solibacillus silvestris]